MKKYIFVLLLILNVSHSLVGQRVLVIGIDGCRSDVATFAQTPNLDLLIASGLSSHDALNDDITISGPGWSAILCGVWSDKHLVTGNNFTINNYAEYPSFFKRIEDFNPSLNTVSIVHWSPINNSIVLSDADVVMNVSSDLAVEQQAVDQLTNQNPHAMFLHFDDIDHAGHAHGFDQSVPEYVTSIEQVDVHIGAVIAAMKNRPAYSTENWAIILTSDHGGINFSHGGNSFEEQNVLFIAAGDSINNEVITRDSLLMASAENCLADSTELAFSGNNQHVEIPHASIFDFGVNQDFTIELRLKTSTAADVAICGNKDWDSGNNKGFVFSFKLPSGPEWKVNLGDGTNRADINIGSAIADNLWHTLSVSFDRDGFMKMYEDGVFIAQTSIANIGDITNGESIFLGTDIDLEYDYSGSIAELRVWDKVLSSTEINDWSCTKLNSSHSSYGQLIGYWEMNEGGASAQILDQINSNHGNIVNAEWSSSDSFYVFDYSKTPRIADASISALAHLCVPIDTSMNLDGGSWIKDCIYKDRDCVNPGINQWIGASSGLWEKAGNWSRGFVPKICDHVYISPSVTITVRTGIQALCHDLTMDSSSKIIVETGGDLKITSVP